ATVEQPVVAARDVEDANRTVVDDGHHALALGEVVGPSYDELPGRHRAHPCPGSSTALARARASAAPTETSRLSIATEMKSIPHSTARGTSCGRRASMPAFLPAA